MIFSEDSRVKIPCILHLVRLGYRYLSLKDAVWDIDTNIFPVLFNEAIARINPELSADDITRLLADVKLLLDNEDLGKAFYERVTERSGIRLIDFENFENNSFHVVTELTYKNGDDEFRSDITLLINGMPLAFVEVKKPNNRDGVLAERNRIITRSRNPKFRRFINITQLMVFSNNMEYEDGSPQPIEGAFYASPSYDSPVFNYFREEEVLDLTLLLAAEDDALENEVLRDNNLNVIKHSPEFLTNKSPDTPTNRICTSLFSRDRLAFLLRFALAYVNESDGLHKHVMRYPQLFATKAIEKKLDAGVKKGIIWHTQGSGKTALAYYNTRFLTDYFQRKGVIPKFYFIVDRLDLLIQAQREFAGRGLVVHTIDSRDAFARDIKTTQVLHNHSGKPEITVVNIQKFQDDSDVVRAEDYDFSIQRVYFLDEVHRSYNPQGSFLANLSQSDRSAIKIGLTGTPSTESPSNFTSEGTPWITPYDLSGNQGNKFITRGTQDVSDEGIKDASLKKLPAGAVLLSSRAPIGYMAIARTELTTNQGFKSFIPVNGFSTAFIYYTVKGSLKTITQYASGSTFKEVSAGVLKTVKIVLPKSSVVEQFTGSVESIFKRQDVLEQENQQLAQLRDWLLPLLMNGQVTVV